MAQEDTNKGQQVADKIRKCLLGIDFRVVYAEGERRVAQEDFKLLSKLGDKKQIRKAISAKARCECYKVYINNLARIKKEITSGLDVVLSKYTPKYKRIWVMYFLEKADIDSISSAVCYSRRSVDCIVRKLKLDLASNYAEVKLDE